MVKEPFGTLWKVQVAMNFWRQNPLRCDKWHPPTDPLQAVPSQAVPQPLPSQDPAALIPSVTSSHMEAKQSRHNMQKCIDILKKYIYVYLQQKKKNIYIIYIIYIYISIDIGSWQSHLWRGNLLIQENFCDSRQHVSPVSSQHKLGQMILSPAGPAE